MNKTLRTISLLTVAVLTSSAVKVWYENKARDDANDARDLAIYQAVKQINETSPRMADADTRIDSATYAAGTMTIFSTLPNVSKKDIDTLAFFRAGREQGVQRLCSGDMSKRLLRSGVSYEYVYRDASGARITDFKIGQNDCQ